MKQKGLAPILIIVLIAAVIGGYFIYQKQNKQTITTTVQQTSQPSPTSNQVDSWKAYSAPNGKYSFQYPANWYLYQDNSGVTIYDRPTDQIPQGGGDSNHIEIGYTTTGTFPSNFAYDNGSSKLNSTIKQYSINNYSGIRGQQIQGQDIVYLKNPNGGYAIFSLWNKSKDENIFDNLLATFKFLDKPNSNSSVEKVAILDTNNWQTVKAKNFSVKAPAGYYTFANDYIINISKVKPENTSNNIGISQVGNSEMGYQNNLYTGGSRRDWYLKQYYRADEGSNPYTFKEEMFGEIPGLVVYNNGRRGRVLVSIGTKLFEFSAAAEYQQTLDTIISTLKVN